MQRQASWSGGAITPLLKKGKDSRVSSRLSKLMGEIAKNDHTSPRGQKIVAAGIESPEGLQLLKGFNFNKRAPFETIFSCPYEVDMATGEVIIHNIITEEQVDFPQAATHVGFRTAFSSINFETSEHETAYSQKEIWPINLKPENITLTPAEIPDAGSHSIMMVTMLIEFFQEVDTVRYPLSNGAHNALAILELG